MSETGTPSVSVVMPVYNAERFVGTAMQSVLVQSLSDFELLIVNDGSDDNSVKICQSLADRRTRILHQKNHGVSSARNSGIAQARARIIAFLDSDDIWATFERKSLVMVSFATIEHLRFCGWESNEYGHRHRRVRGPL